MNQDLALNTSADPMAIEQQSKNDAIDMGNTELFQSDDNDLVTRYNLMQYNLQVLLRLNKQKFLNASANKKTST